MTSDPCNILKEFLEEVKAGNLFSRNLGLCANFKSFCVSHDLCSYEVKAAESAFIRLLHNFPKYTGSPVYPLVPRDKYDVHLHTAVDFYDPATSYGAIRLEFVEWALEEIAQNRVSYMKS